jgi:23S rRNA (uridine2552-2'-O)-methyltransferase
MTEKETLEAVRRELAELVGGATVRVDAVISDMSPNISGVYSVDQAKSVRLARMALAAARELLRPGGRFCVKVFEGGDLKRLLEDVRASFAFVKVHAPAASRKESSEVYVVAKGFRGRAAGASLDEE